MATAVHVRKKWAMGLLAFLAAFGLYAVSAVEKAGATVITPANTAVGFSNALDGSGNPIPTYFVPNNAFGTGAAPTYTQAGLGCTASTADLTVPTNVLNRGALGPWQNNENNPGVGDHSTDSGSVITDLDPKPEFDDCNVYLFSVGSPPANTFVPAAVTTEDGWTVSGDSLNDDEARVAIGVPFDGAIVDIQAVGCQIVVSPDKASAVMADYYNADNRLEVDAQIDIDANANCQGLGVTNAAPAQFEGDYVADQNLQILP